MSTRTVPRRDTSDDLHLALPLLCTLDVRFGRVVHVATPTGVRMLFPVTSGRVEGHRLRGRVVPGSADWLSVGGDGVGRMDVRAVVETDDGALLQLTVTGRVVLGGLTARFLAGEWIDASEAYVRAVPAFDTADERYADLNGLVTLARCDLSLGGIRYRVHEVP